MIGVERYAARDGHGFGSLVRLERQVKGQTTVLKQHLPALESDRLVTDLRINQLEISAERG